jgi:hypothetical protein
MAHVNDIRTLAELARFRARTARARSRLNTKIARHVLQFDELSNRVANALLAEGLRPAAASADRTRTCSISSYSLRQKRARYRWINWRRLRRRKSRHPHDSRAGVLCVSP